jgi:hypothetical protein
MLTPQVTSTPAAAVNKVKTVFSKSPLIAVIRVWKRETGEEASLACWLIHWGKTPTLVGIVAFVSNTIVMCEPA